MTTTIPIITTSPVAATLPTRALYLTLSCGYCQLPWARWWAISVTSTMSVSAVSQSPVDSDSRCCCRRRRFNSFSQGALTRRQLSNHRRQSSDLFSSPLFLSLHFIVDYILHFLNQPVQAGMHFSSNKRTTWITKTVWDQQ